VILAHDLIVWTQALVLDGRLEPKRLRNRLLHVAGRLAMDWNVKLLQCSCREASRLRVHFRLYMSTWHNLLIHPGRSVSERAPWWHG
jgi:hypothetical protein